PAGRPGRPRCPPAARPARPPRPRRWAGGAPPWSGRSVACRSRAPAPAHPPRGGRGRRRRASGARSLALVLVHDLGVDDVVVGGLAGGRAAVTGRRPGGTGRGRGGGGVGGVDRLADLLRDGGQGGLLGLHLLDVVALERGPQLADGGRDLGLHVLRHLIAVVGEDLLGRVDERLGLVAQLGLLAPLLVLGGV